MTNIRRFIAALIGAMMLCQPVAAGSDEAGRLAEALRSDGHVLYWRHALTNQDERDSRISLHDGIPDEEVMADCDSQRNLSDEGRKQAEQIGRALRKAGFTADSIHSSSYCRNLETAERGFPRKSVEVNDQALFNQPALAHESQVDDVTHRLQGLLSAPPESGNRVIIGHNLNIQSAADVRLDEGEMALFRSKEGEEAELIAAFSQADLEALLEDLEEQAQAWQRDDAKQQAVAVYEHLREVESLFHGNWQDATTGLQRSRLRNAARLELAHRLRNDASVELTVIDYYLVLARAALDKDFRSELEQAAGEHRLERHSVSEQASDIARDKRWMHGNEDLHPDGRVPHISVSTAIDKLTPQHESDIGGDVIEVTGMLDFSFVQRAQQRKLPYGFYLLSAHDPEHGVFGDLVCVRDDVADLEFELPWPKGDDMSETERESAILSNIRTSDNGFVDYTQRNLLGTTSLTGQILNAALLTDCRTFLK